MAKTLKNNDQKNQANAGAPVSNEGTAEKLRRLSPPPLEIKAQNTFSEKKNSSNISSDFSIPQFKFNKSNGIHPPPIQRNGPPGGDGSSEEGGSEDIGKAFQEQQTQIKPYVDYSSQVAARINTSSEKSSEKDHIRKAYGVPKLKPVYKAAVKIKESLEQLKSLKRLYPNPADYVPSYSSADPFMGAAMPPSPGEMKTQLEIEIKKEAEKIINFDISDRDLANNLEAKIDEINAHITSTDSARSEKKEARGDYISERKAAERRLEEDRKSGAITA